MVKSVVKQKKACHGYPLPSICPLFVSVSNKEVNIVGNKQYKTVDFFINVLSAVSVVAAGFPL